MSPGIDHLGLGDKRSLVRGDETLDEAMIPSDTIDHALNRTHRLISRMIVPLAQMTSN